MKSGFGISQRSMWVIGGLALAAAALSAWLTVQKLNGAVTTLAGCGGGSDCANVLGSKWSMVLGVVPVSAVSGLLYLGVLASLGVETAAAAWFRRVAAWSILCAAAWYTGLQLVVFGGFCKYCMTMHGVGAVLAVALLRADFPAKGRFAGRVGAALPVAMALVAVLALTQRYGPQPPTHRLDAVEGNVSSPEDIHGRGEGRTVVFFNGQKTYRVGALPRLGPEDAEHVVVEYFDYTCDACREQHGELHTLMEKYRGQLAVVLLPVPLNKRCNPNLPDGLTDHAKACEFAGLAVRVWRADPEKFADFHDWLFANREVPVEAAEAMAASLVGEGALPPANDAWTAEFIRQNVRDYRAFSKETHVLPKLAVKGSLMMQGTAKSGEELEALLKKHLPLR